MNRILVTGAEGLLGAAIVRAFTPDCEVSAAGHAALDIADASAVADVVARTRPDVLVNCAAWNDVDGAESDPIGALRTNALGVRALADACRRHGATLVHFSTDFVFDGEAGRPYREDDQPNPRGVYAASKLLGDYFALAYAMAYVLRVESLFGPPGPGRTRAGSLGTIVGRIAAREPVPVFVDRTVSPAYTPDIAHATRELLRRRAPAGLYHCVNSGAATWADIAAQAARLLDLPLHMQPITLETVALKAPRPRFCALSNARLEAAGIAMPAWQDALQRYLSEGGRAGRTAT